MESDNISHNSGVAYIIKQLLDSVESPINSYSNWDCAIRWLRAYNAFLFIYSFIYLFIYLCIYLCIYVFIYSFIFYTII